MEFTPPEHIFEIVAVSIFISAIFYTFVDEKEFF